MTSTPVYLLLLLISLLMLLPLAMHYWQRYHRKKTYRRVLETLQTCYGNTNPYDLATKANPELLYGEVVSVTLLDLVARLRPRSSDVFYDLGSGCGKTLLAIKLCYPAMTVKGIEQGVELHTLAVEKYREYLASQNLTTEEFEISYIPRNFLEHPFTEATILFINATAFEATWPQILSKLQLLSPGTKVIITSKTLPDDSFSKLYQGMELMSWGLTSTYIYQKK